MTILWAIMLIAVSFLCLLAVLLTLPGTWLMLGATAIVAWVRWDQGMISPCTLAALLALAIKFGIGVVMWVIIAVAALAP